MQCPVDGATLVMTERSGVEIDYCPTCRGVWLDRGELDKLIQQVAPMPQAPLQQAPPMQQAPRYQQPPQYAPPVVVQQMPDMHHQPIDPHHVPVDPYHDPHRRRSFLEEVFGGGHHERQREHH